MKNLCRSKCNHLKPASRLCPSLSRLFEEGNFEPILVKIFRLLDGHSLESCSLVGRRIVLF